jgi:tRNA (cmo5U34)-methyltransferase
LDKNEKIGKGFDKLSPYYSFLSELVFGRQLIKAQTSILPLPSEKRILIAGPGNGTLLKELLLKSSAEEIVCVDISAKMLENCEKQIQNMPLKSMCSIQYVHSPIQHFFDVKKFDLIYFPFVLDCLEEDDIKLTLEQAKEMLGNNGRIILSEFQIPKGFLKRIYAKALLKILYLFFRKATHIRVDHLPHFENLFSRLGFIHAERKEFYAQLLFTQGYKLLPQAGTEKA